MDFLRPQRDQKTFADLFSDLVLRPRSWLTLESVTRYDIAGGKFRLAFHSATVQPNDLWSWSLAHYYLRDDFRPSPTAWGEGNNLIINSMFFKLNENWAFRTSQRFDARRGRMEEQDYTVYRDLRSWTAALTFRVRETLAGPQDFGVAFTFSLKAFPRFGVGSDTAHPDAVWHPTSGAGPISSLRAKTPWRPEQPGGKLHAERKQFLCAT